MAVSHSASLHHNCFLVEDLESAAEELSQALAISWNVWTLAPATCFVYGQPAEFSFRVALAQVGGSILELISPHAGESVYVAHLQENGEGYHHTCLAYADRETLQSAKAELLDKGYEMIQHGYTEGVFEFCYFELPVAGIILELLYFKELPPPEKTIG
jgi:methylmalonyl-CoA/ethylmalonyl-CoA epimerase